MRATITLAFTMLLVGCNTFGEVEPFAGQNTPSDAGAQDAGDAGSTDADTGSGDLDATGDADSDASNPPDDVSIEGYQTLTAWQA